MIVEETMSILRITKKAFPSSSSSSLAFLENLEREEFLIFLNPFLLLANDYFSFIFNGPAKGTGKESGSGISLAFE